MTKPQRQPQYIPVRRPDHTRDPDRKAETLRRKEIRNIKNRSAAWN